ncbi:MAG: DUF5591 domain-containing protein [Nanoarchaeota archaeon]|nr:DUF5591 domain-containing protein [Nanoarchaeota archaeon]
MKPSFARNNWIYLRGVGKMYLHHPTFKKWFRYITTKYKVPKNKEYLLLIPCAWGKPYSQSYIHYLIIQELSKLPFYKKIHQVIMSNAGIIPREFEEDYPFMSYDWNPIYETEETKKMYLEVTKKRILKYLERHAKDYKKVFIYFRRESEEEEAAVKACEKLNLDYTICLSKKTFQNLDQKDYTDWDQVLIEKTSLRDLIKSIRRKTKNGRE